MTCFTMKIYCMFHHGDLLYVLPWKFIVWHVLQWTFIVCFTMEIYCMFYHGNLLYDMFLQTFLSFLVSPAAVLARPEAVNQSVSWTWPNNFPKNHTKIKQNRITKELLEMAIFCSFAIFQADSDPSWQDPPLLHP